MSEWEYKNASDKQLAEASADLILSYLAPQKNNKLLAFYLENVADCFLAIRQQLDFDYDTSRKLQRNLYEYEFSEEKLIDFKADLQKILSDSAAAAHLSEKETLASALLASPEYLLTLRRSEELLTRSTYLFNNEFTYLMDLERDRLLENVMGTEFDAPFSNAEICKQFKAYHEKHFPQDDEVSSLIEKGEYADAFATFSVNHYHDAKSFLDANSQLFSQYYDMELAYQISEENFHNDMDYFGIPMDGGFIEFAHGVGWKSKSGAKVFELEPGKNRVYQFLDKARSIDDGNRETIVNYRVGEPFLKLTEYYHDAPPGGSTMTVIPEAWLDDALKFKNIREEFQNNEILRDILLVKDLQADLKEQSRKNPIAAMFEAEIEDCLQNYGFVDFYMNHGISDLVYDAALNMAKTPAAVKSPKDMLSEIIKLSPKEAFQNEWTTKEVLERDFKNTVADYKKYHSAPTR